MKILITSGGTKEYIDSVRVLTNISTGELGAKIATKFGTSEDVEIHYVAPASAVQPLIETERRNSANPWFSCGGYVIPYSYKSEIYYYKITDVKSVYDIMEELVPKMDIVIHCMAVSDFGFKPATTKLKSSDPLAFIESLKDRIYQTPKILPMIKKWNPTCTLVSFKFEVGLDHEELIEIAKKSMESGNSDIVIANDKVEMTENKSHVAYGLYNGEEVKLNSKDEIVEFLYNVLK